MQFTFQAANVTSGHTGRVKIDPSRGSYLETPIAGGSNSGDSGVGVEFVRDASGRTVRQR